MDLIEVIEAQSSKDQKLISNYFFERGDSDDTTGIGGKLRGKIRNYKAYVMTIIFLQDRDSLQLGLEIEDKFSETEGEKVP